MEEALRSAERETRLLRARLGQVLGCDVVGGPLSINAARAATDFVLAETSAHRDIDKDTALLRSTATLLPLASPVDSPTAAPKHSGDGMEVDDDDEVVVTVVNGGDATATKVTTATHLRRLPGSGKEAETNLVVDHTRLLSILAAENRLSAMADHLGSAEPITISQTMNASSNQLRSAGGRIKTEGTAKSVEAAVSKANAGADAIRRPVGRHFLIKGQDHRPRSAEAGLNSYPSPNCGDSVSRAADGLNSEGYGRKKRSRTSGDEEAERIVGGNGGLGPGRSVLRGSSSFAFGQKDYQTLRNKEEGSACPPLPKLKVSRLDR